MTESMFRTSILAHIERLKLAATAIMYIGGTLYPSCLAAETAPSPVAVSHEHDIVVTASRSDLTGAAVTASQGSITKTALELRPIFRVGQLFEATPGLVVTIHSGEGKANQYLLRGYNLDHGTDLANFIDDMPVNRPTNAHGQGYSDLNFLMPQITNGLDYTKGPYHADIGDFGAVGSAHIRLADEIPSQVSVGIGTLGYQDLYLGTTLRLGGETRLLGAIDVSRYDGPWSPPDNFRKLNAALRASHGNAHDGYDLTALYYKSSGALTTDQPQRAYTQGLISYYGTLDPTDASRSERFSISGHFARTGGNWQLRVNSYFIKSEMILWNNFTHYLDDPANGDQEQQDESRTTYGGAAVLTWRGELAEIANELAVGFQTRHDAVYVDRKHTLARIPLTYCEIQNVNGPSTRYAAINSSCNADVAKLLDVAPYLSFTTHWMPWIRSVVGMREEIYRAADHSLTSPQAKTTVTQTLFQPKGSLILGPWRSTEFYLSAGRGFHSDDARGVLGSVPGIGIPLAAGPTPLLAKNTGYEIGVRTRIIPKLEFQVALFQQDAVSELIYNQDIGQDQASAPSRRQGIEVSAQYHVSATIEINSDLAVTGARYRGDLVSLELTALRVATLPMRRALLAQSE